MSEKRPEIAVLASGSGSTVEAVIHATQDEARGLDFTVGLLIANNTTKGVFERIQRMNSQYGLNIKTLFMSGSNYPGGPGEKGEQTLEESAAICAEINNGGFALVALMGYMKKVRGDLLDQYGWRGGTSKYEAGMVNTHPGPLPETRGLHGIGVQEEVLRIGLGYSAQTLHVVADDYDTGPVIAEHRVPYIPGDTAESLFDSVQLTEKNYLPSDLDSFIKAKA